LLLNLEYRIPIFGPISFAPFFDIGSAFNLRKIDDQLLVSEFVPSTLNNGVPVTLNPRGLIATQRELRQAGLPELGGGLPPGFKFATIRGDQQDTTRIALSDTKDGILDNYRASLGGELRVQVPVINVPFRLIFAWNPNAHTNSGFFLEEKKVVRFSIGRTF
jgi:outer membrane protein insertion porin family